MQHIARSRKILGLLLPAIVSVSALQAAERPNLPFIYTDDQRYDALSVVQNEQGERGRFPWFQAPNMDRLAADAALPGLIARNPNEAMQVGADLGSPVVDPSPPKLTGWIESVRLFSGEYKP